MFKKSLLLVITLLVVGFVITPRVQAQSESDLAEIQRLTDEFLAGRLSMEEFERRTQALLSGIENQAQQQPQQQPQQQQRQQQSQQGANAGWPSESIFRDFFSNGQINQPGGTTSRYDDDGNGLTIYLSGGNANAVLQDLKRQVETLTGRQMDDSGSGTYRGNLHSSRTRRASSSLGTDFSLWEYESVVILSIHAGSF